MTSEKGTFVPAVQLASLPQPVPVELLVIVKKQKAIVNKSRIIKTEINDLAEKLGDLNNTELDDLADELDLISDRFELFRTSLLERLGMSDGK